MTAAVENHFKYLTRFIPLPPFTFHSADDDHCPASKNSNYWRQRKRHDDGLSGQKWVHRDLNVHSLGLLLPLISAVDVEWDVLASVRRAHSFVAGFFCMGILILFQWPLTSEMQEPAGGAAPVAVDASGGRPLALV